MPDYIVAWSGSMSVEADSPEEAVRLIEQARELQATVQVCSTVVSVEEVVRDAKRDMPTYRLVDREQWKAGKRHV